MDLSSNWVNELFAGFPQVTQLVLGEIEPLMGLSVDMGCAAGLLSPYIAIEVERVSDG